MVTQEHQIKKSSSGCESPGVYLCTKCGWPFPKAHPSAKHRRAHKKVCGTIEGYKLVESDDQLAASGAEDQRTPSLMLERGVKELGSSGGISLQSNRSADDLFSDAVAEFSDSSLSPAIENHISSLNKDMEKLAHSVSVEGQSFSVEATAGTLENPIASIQSFKTFNSEFEEQVISHSENANSSSGARLEESPVASIGVTALQLDGSPVIFETPIHELIEGTDADSKDDEINKTLTDCLNPPVEATRESCEPYSSIEGTLENSMAPVQSIKTSNSEVDEQVISQSENANSPSEARLEESPVVSIGATVLPFDASPVIFETPKDELAEGIDADVKDEKINKTLTDSLNPHLLARRESSEPYSSIEGTLDNLIAPIQSIKIANSEVDEQVISQSENANSSGEAKTEETLVASIGVTSLQFDASPVISETPADELVEGIDAHVKDEGINKTFLNTHVEATRESSDHYLNGIDQQTSENIWEDSLTSVPVIRILSKSEANEGKTFAFVTQDTLVENDISPLEKHLHTENSVTEFDGNRSGDKSEVHRIFEQSGVGKDIDVSLFKKKEEEATVSNFKEQNEADIAVYTLLVPDSLAALANVAHLNEDFKDYASRESSLPLDFGSSKVITYVGDDKQSNIAGQSVPGDRLVDSSCGIDGSTTDQNTLKDNLNEKEVEKPITNKSCVSGSTDETTNLLGGDDVDQNKMSEIEESDEGIKQSDKRPMEDQLAANDKRTLGADSSFLFDDNQITSSLKAAHHSQVLKEAVAELSEVSETIEKSDGAIEKNTEIRRESAGPIHKSSDVDVHRKFDSRGNMEQIPSSSCKGAYTLSQHGTGNVTDNIFSVASAVKTIERNHNLSILSASQNQGAFITNEVARLPVGSELLNQASNIVDVTHSSKASKESPGCGSESLQGKGDDKLETRHDGVSVSITSSSRADSMDGNWGSVSVASLQSDAAASADPGVPSDKTQTTSLPVRKDAAESHTMTLDDYEPPSFMTLVEPGNGVSQKDTPSFLSALRTQQQNDEDPKAGWFPSISNVVNESPGRKKNEEIIDKVSSWSTGKKHSPLKNLLGEARSTNSERRSSATERDEISLKNSGAAVTTVDAILRSEPNGKEIEKEWNSPARYPVEIKKEKKKRKPYWVPFVCCLSVQRDL